MARDSGTNKGGRLVMSHSYCTTQSLGDPSPRYELKNGSGSEPTLLLALKARRRDGIKTSLP